MNDELPKNTGRDTNPDPITGEPGAHPVSTGVGAAAAGAAGAAIGAMAGPVGVVAGAVIGAVVGGYGGKAAGEAIDPSAEDAYWRENHAKQDYAMPSESFDAFAPAYRSGYEGFAAHGTTLKTFEEAEAHLKAHYAASNPGLPWERVREASRRAWVHAQAAITGANPSADRGSLKIFRSAAGRTERRTCLHKRATRRKLGGSFRKEEPPVERAE